MTAFLMRPESDPMGAAIYDYQTTGRASRLVVHSSMFDDDEMPVAHLFRPYEQMPPLERLALRMAKGRILDVGAGSGCHSVALEAMGKTVTAIDISPLSVDAMRLRGLRDVRWLNLYDETFTEQFDTMLFLMNGSTIIGTIGGMEAFFARVRQLLAPGGCVLLDSTDLQYVYLDDDGNLDLPFAPDERYYGEVDYRMGYGNVEGEPFDCLYVDFATLRHYADLNGFDAELVERGEHYDYLARLSPRPLDACL